MLFRSLRFHGAAGGRRHRAGFCRAVGRRARRARLGGGAHAGRRHHRERAGDCPFLPRDLVARLAAARSADATPLACARSGEWRHPVVGLWPVVLRADLRRALTDEGLHKIEIWTSRHGVAIADWPNEPVDPFFNVNRPEDLAEAERLCRLYPVP